MSAAVAAAAAAAKKKSREKKKNERRTPAGGMVGHIERKFEVRDGLQAHAQVAIGQLDAHRRASVRRNARDSCRGGLTPVGLALLFLGLIHSASAEALRSAGLSSSRMQKPSTVMRGEAGPPLAAGPAEPRLLTEKPLDVGEGRSTRGESATASAGS